MSPMVNAQCHLLMTSPAVFVQKWATEAGVLHPHTPGVLPKGSEKMSGTEDPQFLARVLRNTSLMESKQENKEGKI